MTDTMPACAGVICFAETPAKIDFRIYTTSIMTNGIRCAIVHDKKEKGISCPKRERHYESNIRGILL